MGLLRYSEQEFRELVSRIIPLRWPNEQMLLVTGCRGERVPETPEGAETFGGSSTQAETVPGHGGRSVGFLAATQSRVIYQERTPSTAMIKAILALTVALAVVALFTGRGIVDFLGLAAGALGLWFVERVAEHVSVGKINIEFGRIAYVDSLEQQIDGVAHSGSVYRLHIPDAGDFQMIRTLAAAV
jgi:hypothetical protein